ncbi:phosphoribosylanthranilate isomerase [Novipirellula herctigrandis]|uniref:phosphoribosylanthranilate isomerase n=1 Tax=Novipirellula herctigrandis TaxID=2527986 RepID=UPI003AF36110
MFHIKICGIRLKSDIDAIEAAGGDAVGLNFFPKSIRYLDPQSASTGELAIYAQKRGLTRVGVFVNESAERIGSISEKKWIDVIQLHGDETLGDAKALAAIRLPILRAIKLPAGPIGVNQIDSRIRPWTEAGFGVLLDVDAGPAHGGSGTALDWDSLGRWSKANEDTSWTLAGGLRPDNVAEAINVTGAKSVDVASGVESPRGKKSATLISEFCRNANP